MEILNEYTLARILKEDGSNSDPTYSESENPLVEEFGLYQWENLWNRIRGYEGTSRNLRTDTACMVDIRAQVFANYMLNRLENTLTGRVVSPLASSRICRVLGGPGDQSETILKTPFTDGLIPYFSFVFHKNESLINEIYIFQEHVDLDTLDSQLKGLQTLRAKYPELFSETFTIKLITGSSSVSLAREHKRHGIQFDAYTLEVDPQEIDRRVAYIEQQSGLELPRLFLTHQQELILQRCIAEAYYNARSRLSNPLHIEDQQKFVQEFFAQVYNDLIRIASRMKVKTLIEKFDTQVPRIIFDHLVMINSSAWSGGYPFTSDNQSWDILRSIFRNHEDSEGSLPSGLIKRMPICLVMENNKSPRVTGFMLPISFMDTTYNPPGRLSMIADIVALSGLRETRFFNSSKPAQVTIVIPDDDQTHNYLVEAFKRTHPELQVVGEILQLRESSMYQVLPVPLEIKIVRLSGITTDILAYIHDQILNHYHPEGGFTLNQMVEHIRRGTLDQLLGNRPLH